MVHDQQCSTISKVAADWHCLATQPISAPLILYDHGAIQIYLLTYYVAHHWVTTYDFLLVIHGNYDLYRTISEIIGDIG